MTITNLLARVSAAALLVGLAPAAFAQTTPPPTTDPVQAETPTGQDAEPEDVSADGTTVSDSESGTIVVTGTRIRRPNLDTFEPTITVDEQYIEERNLTNVADALNELPAFRGSITPNGAQGTFGQGVNFANAFGLGSNRTLTLVNGRRFVSSNVATIFNQGSQGTQVDLNVIPTVLVQRIDNISVGGAPVYGSDAISGVVNVILKTDLTGVEVSGVSRITEQGDGFSYNFSVAAGQNFDDDRGNITLAYQRDRQQGVLYNSRDFLRENYGVIPNPASRPGGIGAAFDGRINTNFGFNTGDADGVPPSVIVRDRTLTFLTPGGLITSASAGGAPGTNSVINAALARNFQFDSNGNLIPFDRGTPFVGTNSTGGSDEAFRFNDFAQITSELQRDVIYGTAKYTYSPGFELFMEGTYFKSRGDELVQQPTFNSSLFGGLSGPVTFSINSPFLTPQARAELASRGVSSFQLSRASTDLADATGFSENELYRGVVGARGEFAALGRTLNYEVSGIYGRTDITDVRQDINAQNFVNAVNVTTNAAGEIICAGTQTGAVSGGADGLVPIPDAACRPLNLLGFGRASPEARAYVIANDTTRSSLEQWVINANINGSLFDLFGNTIGFAAGYEHREERASFTPGPFSQAGLGRSVAIGPVSGSYNVDEVFGELLVPLVSPSNNLRFLSKLELFARGRYVDNTVNGGFFSYSAGGSVAPIPDIEFRGEYTRSFRAPAITELFLPTSNTFTAVPDLCSPRFINAGAAPETRARNCAAFLAAFPNATPLDAEGATVPGQSGGNPNLLNEVAYSFAYGVILRPRFLPRFSATIDYVNIRIEQPIANLGVAAVASACFDNEDFDASDPANGNAFCSQIQRYTAADGGTAVNGGSRAGQVVNDPANPGVRTGFTNGNQIKFSGIQGTFDYRLPLSGVNVPGDLQFDGNLLYVRSRLIDITGVAPIQSEGELGDPEFAAQVNARYIGDDFGITGSFNYVGEQLFARTPRGIEFREIDQLNDYITVNASVYVDVQDKFRLALSVTNLTNYIGQEYYDAIIPASYTDLLGRRYAVSARARF